MATNRLAEIPFKLVPLVFVVWPIRTAPGVFVSLALALGESREKKAAAQAR
jgi:hypothetical protein